jgi:hypothetical protein
MHILKVWRYKLEKFANAIKRKIHIIRADIEIAGQIPYAIINEKNYPLKSIEFRDGKYALTFGEATMECNHCDDVVTYHFCGIDKHYDISETASQMAAGDILTLSMIQEIDYIRGEESAVH